MDTSAFMVGAEFRDTYGDTKTRKNRRHVRLLSKEPDGRWLCQAFWISERSGTTTEGNKSRISEKTLSSAYVPRGT